MNWYPIIMILISFYSKLIELTNRISLYILLFWIQWENKWRTRETQFWRRKKNQKVRKKWLKYGGAELEPFVSLELIWGQIWVRFGSVGNIKKEDNKRKCIIESVMFENVKRNKCIVLFWKIILEFWQSYWGKIDFDEKSFGVNKQDEEKMKWG